MKPVFDIEQITPRAAYERLQQNDGHVYVDVRSQREFLAGHPKGAFNVPLLDYAPNGQIVPNLDFVRVMRALFPPERKILLGCKSGGRSQQAGIMLHHFGYRSLANVSGGFHGAPFVAGWAASGLPCDCGPEDGRSYQDLRNALQFP